MVFMNKVTTIILAIEKGHIGATLGMVTVIAQSHLHKIRGSNIHTTTMSMIAPQLKMITAKGSVFRTNSFKYDKNSPNDINKL